MTQSPSVSSVPSPTLKPSQVLLVGKVRSTERRGDRHTTVIVMPAPDPYSMPATVAVTSDTRIGQPGDDVSVVARVSGKSESWKDRESGEVRNGARMWLEAVGR